MVHFDLYVNSVFILIFTEILDVFESMLDCDAINYNNYAVAISGLNCTDGNSAI